MTEVSVPQFDGIPQEMRDFPNWVLWRMEERDGKSTKVPYDPKCTFKRAKADNPRTWATWDQVIRAFSKGGFTGIGFQFSNTPFFGVDTDHKPFDGDIHPLAYNLLERLDTYSEISPSKKGQHAIGRGNLPEWAMHKKRLAPDLEIEVYSEGRFFTITGDIIFSGQVEERQEALEEMLKSLGMVKPSPAPRKATTGQAAAFTGSDSQLWERMFSSRNGAALRALAGGDLTQHEGDHSRADFALCSHLAFWCNGDAGRMDAMFRSSGLMRPKWDEKHSSDGSTYGQITLTKVLDGWSGEGYDPTRGEKEKTTERENWTNPEVLLRGRQHLASSGSHGNTVNSYSTLWHALVQVIEKGLYTQEGDVLTITSVGMTELYALAGGRPVDRRNQLSFLHSQGMAGRLKRKGTDSNRNPWVLEVPANPASLPFWHRGSLQQPLAVSSHTGRPAANTTPSPAPPLVNNYCERENPKTRKMPFWTLFALANKKQASTRELAQMVGLSERTVSRHLMACPTLVTRTGGQWAISLSSAEVAELHSTLEAPRVHARREALLKDRVLFHETKARYLRSQGFHRAAERHDGYATLYRQITGVNAA